MGYAGESEFPSKPMWLGADEPKPCGKRVATQHQAACFDVMGRLYNLAARDLGLRNWADLGLRFWDLELGDLNGELGCGALGGDIGSFVLALCSQKHSPFIRACGIRVSKNSGSLFWVCSHN